MTWVEAAGYFASLLVFTTFCMKTMIPLRLAALGSNVAFIVYGFYGHIYPVLILHAVLFPTNVWRMIEMLHLVRRVEAAAKGDLSVDWLKPFMKSARYSAGDLLFRAGDDADRLYMVLTGEILLEELGITLDPGDVFGEIALFSAAHQRTQSARCMTDIELLWIGESDLAQLCYQNPAMSFHLLRLITNRLLVDATLIKRRRALV
ncbi:MAG TPA: cyclic nucleotide-binding domain-containing protein [Pseudolabrys sp.]|nr:cyclic nucleotide-binding domain-containing protein [Pseudolabrys sp.]